MLVLGASPKLNLVTSPKASPNESSHREKRGREKTHGCAQKQDLITLSSSFPLTKNARSSFKAPQLF